MTCAEAGDREELMTRPFLGYENKNPMQSTGLTWNNQHSNSSQARPPTSLKSQHSWEVTMETGPRKFPGGNFPGLHLNRCQTESDFSIIVSHLRFIFNFAPTFLPFRKLNYGSYQVCAYADSFRSLFIISLGSLDVSDILNSLGVAVGITIYCIVAVNFERWCPRIGAFLSR